MSQPASSPSPARVAVFTLGGTIASTGARGAPVTPELSGEDLVASVPGLAGVAELEVHELRRLPSGDLGFGDLVELATRARAASQSGVAGVVVVQGTDTLEETALALELLCPGVVLVLTGAMRHPQSAGADGPANLLAAVRVAASASARGLGALVVMNEEIHAARWVRKSHATSPGAFASPSLGPLGQLIEGAAHVRVHPEPLEALDISAQAVPPVALYEVCLGDDGRLLGSLAEAGYAGVVIGAFGAGHVPGALAEPLGALASRMPVVLASRTGAGSVLGATYGFVGSESDLLGRGLISAGSLDARKARVVLSLLLASGATHQRVVDYFDELRRRV